ncbi:MAG: hypothetical protein ACYTGN_07940 [Planctomycetota bacterium]|jgi:hypothetical protein
MDLQFIIIPLIVAIAIVAIYASWLSNKKRREAMERLARAYNGKFHADDPYGLSERYRRRFDALTPGSNRYAYNVVRCADFTLFDHHHQTSDGKNTHHHHRTFLLYKHDTDLGSVHIRPEHFGDKLAAFAGFDDIDFESAAFSKRYHVKSDDKKLAYGLFHPGMIEYFMGMRDITLAASEHLVLATRGMGRLNPLRLRKLVKDVEGFVEHIPRYMQKDRNAS